MKVGLISCTQVPRGIPELPPQVATVFAGVDLILHAGDIMGVECLDWLERIAPVRAVEAAPGPDLRDDPRVTDRTVIEAGGYAIGLTYDLVIPGSGFEPVPGLIASRYPAGQSIPAALEYLFGRAVDIVVFGHVPRSLLEEHQGVLFVNPGSPTFPNQSRRLGTVGVLELTPERRTATIIDLTQFPP